MEPRRFFLDTQSRQFVASPAFPAPAIDSTLFGEDVEEINLYFLKDGNFVDYSGKTVKLAVGITAPLALATSWSAISTGITPTVSSSVNGSAGTSEVQTLTFAPAPEVGSYALRLPARNVTVSSISASIFLAGNHGLLNGQSVTLTGFTTPSGFSNGVQYAVVNRTRDGFQVADTAGGTAKTVSVASGGGTAQLDAITTPQIAATASATDIEDAFVAAGIVSDGAPQIIVTGSASSGFTFIFSNSQSGIDFAALQVVGSTLSRARGLVGTLNLNTTGISSAISAGTTSVSLEVEVSGDGLRQTYQQNAVIGDDVITSTSSIPTPIGNTVGTLNFTDGEGGTWAMTVDANGIVTTTKQ